MVPFTPCAGLLEWVEDSLPLAEYLTGADRQSGAQKRYARPTDLNFAQCFSHYMASQKSKKSNLRAT